MIDLRRLLPPEFLEAYWDAFHAVPPVEFLEAYELLCEALYFGVRPDEMPPELTSRGRDPQAWFFREPDLFRPKSRVDSYLAQTSKALRAWSASRSGTRAYGRHVGGAGRGDLARAGSSRDRGPHVRREEA